MGTGSAAVAGAGSAAVADGGRVPIPSAGSTVVASALFRPPRPLLTVVREPGAWSGPAEAFSVRASNCGYRRGSIEEPPDAKSV
jgi:hypothetical protein